MCIVSQDSYTNPCLVIAPLAPIGELHATSSHDLLDRLGPVMAVSGQGHLRSRVGSMVRRRSVHHDRSPGSLFLTIAQCTTLPGEARYSSVHGLTQSQRSAADLRRFLKGEPTRSGFPRAIIHGTGPSLAGWVGSTCTWHPAQIPCSARYQTLARAPLLFRPPSAGFGVSLPCRWSQTQRTTTTTQVATRAASHCDRACVLHRAGVATACVAAVASRKLWGGFDRDIPVTRPARARRRDTACYTACPLDTSFPDGQLTVPHARMHDPLPCPPVPCHGSQFVVRRRR